VRDPAKLAAIVPARTSSASRRLSFMAAIIKE
jgi:hypothetical protein